MSDKLKRVLSALLLAVLLLTVTACTQVQEESSNASFVSQDAIATIHPISQEDLKNWVQETLEIQNQSFKVIELRAYYITQEQLQAYSLLANPSTAQVFGFDIAELSTAFERGSAITVFNNQVIEAATLETSNFYGNQENLVDASFIDWDSFFKKVAVTGGVLILSAVLAPLTGGTVSCALMTVCTTGMVEAVTSAGAAAIMKTVEGLMSGKTLADSVHAAMLSNETAQAFADGFLLGALVGAAMTPLVQMCFPAQTPVLTENGYIPIENVRVGDRVLSYHESTGAIEFSQVTQTHVSKTSSLVKVELSDGGAIEATPEHPFYLAETQTWMPAKYLQPGDRLFSCSGNTVSVISVEYENLPAEAIVYNLSVNGTYTYYVGSAAEAVLVHNTCKINDKHLYETGFYGDLTDARKINRKEYSGLEAHHVPSKHFLKRYGIDADNGLAVFIDKSTHQRTMTYGRFSSEKRSFYDGLSFSEALQVDLSNLRAVLRSEGADAAVIEQINRMEDLYRQLYPHLFS